MTIACSAARSCTSAPPEGASTSRMAADERFLTPAQRALHRDELDAFVGEVTLTRTTAAWGRRHAPTLGQDTDEVLAELR